MAIDRDYLRSVLRLASALCAVEWTSLPEGGMFTTLNNGCALWAEANRLEIRGPARVVSLLRLFPGREADVGAAVSAALLEAVLQGGSPLDGGLRVALTEDGVECECLAV